MEHRSDRDAALTNEQAWWRTGSSLAAVSGVVGAWTAAGSFPETIKVGSATISRLCGPDGFGYVWPYRLIDEMLYAFAVECWLKGIIVADIGTSDAEIILRQEIRDVLIAAVGDLAPYSDEFREAYGLANGQLTEKRVALGAEGDKRRSSCLTALKPHRSHDLGRLAGAAGITLDDALMEYLQILSDAVQVGRYPWHNSKEACEEPRRGVDAFKEELGDFVPILDDPKRRDELNRAISDRWAQIQGSDHQQSLRIAEASAEGTQIS